MKYVGTSTPAYSFTQGNKCTLFNIDKEESIEGCISKPKEQQTTLLTTIDTKKNKKKKKIRFELNRCQNPSLLAKNQTTPGPGRYDISRNSLLNKKIKSKNKKKGLIRKKNRKKTHNRFKSFGGSYYSKTETPGPAYYTTELPSGPLLSKNGGYMPYKFTESSSNIIDYRGRSEIGESQTNKHDMMNIRNKNEPDYRSIWPKSRAISFTREMKCETKLDENNLSKEEVIKQNLDFENLNEEIASKVSQNRFSNKGSYKNNNKMGRKLFNSQSQAEIPGPGTYDILNNYSSQNGILRRGKHKNAEPEITPSGCDYNIPEYISKNKSKILGNFNKTKKRRTNKNKRKIGPGYYFIDDFYKNKYLSKTLHEGCSYSEQKENKFSLRNSDLRRMNYNVQNGLVPSKKGVKFSKVERPINKTKNYNDYYGDESTNLERDFSNNEYGSQYEGKSPYNLKNFKNKFPGDFITKLRARSMNTEQRFKKRVGESGFDDNFPGPGQYKISRSLIKKKNKICNFGFAEKMKTSLKSKSEESRLYDVRGSMTKKNGSVIKKPMELVDIKVLDGFDKPGPGNYNIFHTLPSIQYFEREKIERNGFKLRYEGCIRSLIK